MITARDIADWSTAHPWATDLQVEQDLLLSRAICEIAAHPYLSGELVFRGGTAFHKLHLPEPLRYSEDLDYVRTTAGPVGPLLTALRHVGENLGFKVNTQVGAHPKAVWRTTSDGGLPLRIKIDVNTHERSPALPLATVPFSVASRWWSGEAQVPTFQAPELVATKIRALYQRLKGRDLFDLWLALTQLGLDPAAILTAFEPYRPEGLTAALSVANLCAKIPEPRFRDDIATLAVAPPAGYDIDAAAELIITDLLSKLDG